MDKLQSRFHELFAYVDGKLVRKVSIGSAKAGSFADYKESNGYLRVRVDGVRYGVHQIVFCMQNGYIPSMLDHINGIKTDNRIENLRVATPSQNGYNTKIKSSNTTGVKNVQWVKHMSKWQVRLRINKQIAVIGHFQDLELAELVAMEARHKYHGNYANNGLGVK